MPSPLYSILSIAEEYRAIHILHRTEVIPPHYEISSTLPMVPLHSAKNSTVLILSLYGTEHQNSTEEGYTTIVSLLISFKKVNPLSPLNLNSTFEVLSISIVH